MVATFKSNLSVVIVFRQFSDEKVLLHQVEYDIMRMKKCYDKKVTSTDNNWR